MGCSSLVLCVLIGQLVAVSFAEISTKTCSIQSKRCGEGFGGHDTCCGRLACQYTNRVEQNKRVYICCKRWYYWDGYEMVYPTCRYGKQRDRFGCTLRKCNKKLPNLSTGQVNRTIQSSIKRDLNHLSKFAVDNNMHTWFASELKNKVHWWMVYLGEVSVILHVVLHSFDKTGDGVLSGKINVEDSEFRVKNTCGYAYKSFSQEHGNHLVYKVRCQYKLTGDYVRMYRRHSLRLREVEVYGYFS